ncbi:TELO2-interacting protein 2 [Nematostella vectensis]|uniref:TELO2-interacting protein 2 n=1 Tax=Nematostella vectensis TaxID=45351 RepID=UPI00207764BF|nr:TELO2-interacting protein 2 [Nematostella vectensis]
MAASALDATVFLDHLRSVVSTENILFLQDQLDKHNLNGILKQQCVEYGPVEGYESEEYITSLLRHISSKLLPPGRPEEGEDDSGTYKTYVVKAGNLLELCGIIITCISRTQETKNLALVRHIMKKVAPELISICACHMEANKWTSQKTRSSSKVLLTAFCKGFHCSSESELLSGTASSTIDGNPVLREGLFGRVLNVMLPHMSKSTWEDCRALRYAFVWCVLQVKYPVIGDHIPRLLPPMLLLLDDHEVEYTIVGVTALHHVIINTNVAELHWYGRADVIFESLQKLIYTNVPRLAMALHPCVVSLLKVMEPKPWKPKTNRTEGWKCHGVFQAILTSMEFESKIAMRRVYADTLKGYVDYLGISLLKHFKRFLRVVFAYLEIYDPEGDQTRIGILLALKSAMIHAYMRIPAHSDAILKALLKLMIDTTLSMDTVQKGSALSAQNGILDAAIECLAVLQICCGNHITEALETIQANFEDPQLQQSLQRVLQAHVNEQNKIT